MNLSVCQVWRQGLGRLVVHESFLGNIRFSRAPVILSGHEMNDKCDLSCMIAWHEYTTMPPYEHKLAVNYWACTLHETNMASCKPLSCKPLVSLEIWNGICGHDKVSTILSIQQYCSRETTKLTTIAGLFSTNHEPIRRDRSACIIGVVIHLPCIVSNIALIFSSCRQAQLNRLVQPKTSTPDREVHVFFQPPARHRQTYCIGTLVILHKLLLRQEINTDFFFLLSFLDLILRQSSADICSEIKHPTFEPSQAGFIQAQTSRWRKQQYWW